MKISTNTEKKTAIKAELNFRKKRSKTGSE